MTKSRKATQVKSQAKTRSDKPTLSLIFSAIALAMGIAVVILALTNSINVLSCMVMLGVGLFCLGVVCLMKSDCD